MMLKKQPRFEFHLLKRSNLVNPFKLKTLSDSKFDYVIR